MKITAHCFAENVNITPNSFLFKYKGYDVKILSFEKQLLLQLSKIADDQDKENIKRSIGDNLEIKMMPYKLILTEVAQVLEGLFAILYSSDSIPPKFDTSRINVNIVTETKEEKKLIADGIIYPSFGNVGKSPDTSSNYTMDDSIIPLIESSINHLPAFSFFAQATRSLHNNENEIAFFLFFRIIDGYFSDGAKDVEKALIKKAKDLETFLPYDEDLKKSTKSILTEMQGTSKSENNYNGFISDMVLIRHKLTHFSSTNAKKHHSAKIIFELMTLNIYLHHACALILRNKINVE